MAEITIDYPNFRFNDFIKVLKDKVRKLDWAIIEDSEEILDRKFSFAATKHGDLVVFTGIHDIGEGYNRIKIFIMVDLKAIKATMTALDVGTKVLTALGIIATGTIGFAIAAGKFTFSKILNFKKKKDLESFWKNVIKEILEKDLEYKGLLIEDYEIGLPQISDEERLYWNNVYKSYLDLLEMKLRRKLVSMALWDARNKKADSKRKEPNVMVYRDRLFRDGIVDIVGYAKLKDAIQMVFVFTNRKTTATPFTLEEITSILRGADGYAHFKFANERKPIQTTCIFISATTPPFSQDIYNFIETNYYVVGDLDSKVPLIFLIPPLEKKVEERKRVSEKMPFGEMLEGIIQKGLEIFSGIAKESIWHNIYRPSKYSMLISKINKIPFSNFLKIPVMEDDTLKYSYEGPITIEKYQQIVDRFLFEWENLLTPHTAAKYLNLQKFYEARSFVEAQLNYG